jgi:hypothetical protein
MRPLFLFASAIGAASLLCASPVVAQHHINTAPQHHNTGAAPMHFPNNTINFPNNAFNFPNNTINFPNNAFNFPNNTINFPNNAIHFPNNAINFPVYAGGYYGMTNYSPYGMGYYGGGYPYSPHPRKGTHSLNSVSSSSAANATAFMGYGVGVGSAYAVSHHPHYGSLHHSRAPHYATNRNTGRSTGSTVTPAQRHYNKLVADLDSLSPQFAIADTHRNTLKGDVMAVAEGTHRPDATTVQHLSQHLADAMTRRKSQVINTAMLAGDIRLIVNSGPLPKAQVDQAIAQTQHVLKEGGFRQADIQTVVADMHAVAAKARTQVAAQANAVK